ncbi:MAG: carbon-nitrogen hydrolase family protein [Acidobacteria bacterium]|nr:carbon-nitrogen hydrolase family protein [Acidobacteriota bacterium]
MRFFCHAAVVLSLAGASLAGAEVDGWQSRAPRAEITPVFRSVATGGPTGQARLLIEGDGREGLAGSWRKLQAVTGGQRYRFSVWRRTVGLESDAHNAFVTLDWLDAQGRRVADSRPLVADYLKTLPPTSTPEYPRETTNRRQDWVEIAADYEVPQAAVMARIDLHYRWSAKGRVEWSAPSLAQSSAVSASRKARLAAVHYKPQGPTPAANREQYVALIEEAAAQKADLVVLGETLTYVNTGLSYADAAEPIPGPSTQFFGQLARKHQLYLVAGLLERAGHLVYNVSVLIGPDGNILGRYRKVTLPDGEWEGGLTPGRDYPVFDTRFGKVGMMICYDGFFPEVARELTLKGAEVIAWPVWGCNPQLAKARAAENHVYLVSSTYEPVQSNWMLSAIWSHTGDTLAQGQQWGTVSISEVDLETVTRWKSLGDFKGRIPHHTPLPKR